MNHANFNESQHSLSLSEVGVNIPVRIKALVHNEPAVCQRLREMGFCEFAEVCKISHGGALICRVCDVNIALSRQLAESILVETTPA